MKKRITSVLLVFALVVSFIALPPFGGDALSAYAVDYPTNYPNTHVNTGNKAADIVAVAKTQIGYTGGLSGETRTSKYGAWAYQNGVISWDAQGHWCQYFVSWCANQAGISNGDVYYHYNTTQCFQLYVNDGRFKYSTSYGGAAYTPKAGDIIYFTTNGTSTYSGHVGIVEKCVGTTVYTIEGNMGNVCGTRTISLSDPYILGFAIPNYNLNTQPTTCRVWAGITAGVGDVYFDDPVTHTTDTRVTQGTRVYFRTVPGENYHVSKVIVGGTSYDILENGGNAVYSFLMPYGDVYIEIQFAPNTPAYSTGVYEITADALYVRSAPVDGTILGVLHKGDRITALEIVNTYWARINYNGSVAYVSVNSKYATRVS